MIPIPKAPNDEVRLAAARVTAQVLIDEAEVEGDVEEIAADIAKHCRHGDGFRMAKDLEGAHWICDMRIAEVLDSHSGNIDHAQEQFLAAFQKVYNIQPPLPLGTSVSTRFGLGVVDSVCKHRPMTFAVKMDGDARAEPPTNRRCLFYFDEVEAV